MVSTPEVVIRFVGKGELRRLGGIVRRMYGVFRSGLRRRGRWGKGSVGERYEEAEEVVGNEAEEAMGLMGKAEATRRWGHKVKPARDHPWRRFRYGRRLKQ